MPTTRFSGGDTFATGTAAQNTLSARLGSYADVLVQSCNQCNTAIIYGGPGTQNRTTITSYGNSCCPSSFNWESKTVSGLSNVTASTIKYYHVGEAIDTRYSEYSAKFPNNEADRQAAWDGEAHAARLVLQAVRDSLQGGSANQNGN